MGDDWRMRECVNQMLLYVAMRAWHAIVNRPSDGDPIRAPLPPVHKAVDAETDALCEELGTSPDQLNSIHKLMNRVSDTETKKRVADRIHHSAPWKISDLVGWWIVAGQAIARSRSMTNGSAADAPERRGAWVLENVVSRLVLEDDEEWPPLWLAERADSWRLREPATTGTPITWEKPGTSDSDYRRHLLDWCGDPHREQSLPAGAMDEAKAKAWLREYQARYREFARSSLRLLREGCHYGGLRDAETVSGGWTAYRSSFLPGGMFDVLRRPVHRRAATNELPVARGWIVVPRPAAIIAQFRHGLAERAAPGGSLAGLIDRAAAGWDGESTTFGQSLDAGSAGGSALARVRHVSALAALATAMELAAPSEGGGEQRGEQIPADPSERVRLALALEHIAVRREPAPLDDRARVIPLDTSATETMRGLPAKLTLSLGTTSSTVDIGTFAIAACCPEGLRVAIEDVDWRTWSLQICGATPAKVLAAAGWERIKRRLLAMNVSEQGMLDLASAFDTLHPVRLELEREQAGDEQAAWLVEAIASLERALCGLLAEGKPAVATRLNPPRTADAEVCLEAWLDAQCADDPCVARWDVAWERSPAPFGRAIREELQDGDRFRIAFSAGKAATDEDLRLLAAPGVVCRPAGPWNTIAAPMVAVIRTAIQAGTSPDVSAMIRGVTQAFAGDTADAFDELVRQATAGNAIAMGWMRMLQEDARAAFACYPAVDTGESRATVRPVSVNDAFLEWRDDDAPTDHEISIRFATDSARARRVFSRGRPAPTSADAAAERLEAVVRGGPAAVEAAASALRSATDRRRMFREAAPDPLVAALAVADALAAAGGEMPHASAVFHELSAWFQVSGCRLTPDHWHPTEGIAADGLEVTRAGFHATVSPGRVVVERFGATRADGSSAASWDGYKSAGPPPEGFDAVERLAAALTGDHAEILTLQRSVARFAIRALEGQASPAAANLFDVAWKARLARPEDPVLRETVAAVQTLLQKAYKMIAFTPKSLGEYPEDWLHDPHDRPARGQRLERVVRPGLKKIDNVLVFPAKVETA